MNSQGYPNGALKASDHIRLAEEMLVLLGDADKINNRQWSAESDCKEAMALAIGAQAHIDMARFKLDHAGVMQKINHGRTNTED